MKAWQVSVKDEFYSTVVFAETRGKAKSVALSTECCEYARFTDIEVRRLPQMDKYHKEGKTEMDWDDPLDRLALVKECSFVCDCETREYENCEICSAREFCDGYRYGSED